jgi:hypothetical protein
MCISLFTIGRKYVKFLAWAQYKKIKDRKHKHLMPHAEANPSDNSKKNANIPAPQHFSTQKKNAPPRKLKRTIRNPEKDLLYIPYHHHDTKITHTHQTIQQQKHLLVFFYLTLSSSHNKHKD